MIFDSEGNPLPTFDGAKDKTLGRTMLRSVGGPSGVRTRVSENADGSTTLLRTRNGYPEFTTATTTKSGVGTLARGFVAHAPGARTGVLFDPYTLAVLNPRYTPVNAPYVVQSFATSWNVPTADMTHWCDTVIFNSRVTAVNNKQLPILNNPTGLAFPATPYVVKASTSEPYGDRTLNTTQKRVFAVGRYSVQSWGGGGTVETLTPTEPRTENRCLTIGQRIDRDTNAAWVGQLYHGVDGWDGATEWYFTGASVQMLLTSTYLVKASLGANVAMTPPTLASLGTVSGTMVTATNLPSTEVALMAHGVTGVTTPYVSNTHAAAGSSGLYSCHFEFNAIASRELEGTVNASYSRVSYGGSVASSEVAAGVALSYYANNEKKWDVRTESTSINTQSVVLFVMDDSGVSNALSVDMTGDSSALYWGQYYTAPPVGGLNAGGPGPNRGTPNKNISGESISSSTVTRNYDEQTCSFYVTADSIAIVSGSFTRNKSYGPKPVFSPNPSSYYHTIIDTYTWPGPTYSGMGVYNGPVVFQAYSDPATDVTWIRRYHGIYYGSPYDWYEQPDEAVNTINAKYSDMRAQFQAQTCYDSENSSGYTESSARGGPYYTATISPSVTIAACTLNWTTKDYLLHDTENGVFITVEATFAGVDALATLTVLLRVKTRHHDVTQTLGVFSYNYGTADGMLPEREIGSTGKYAVPSPQIRAMFAPLYQEQGSFKGAHYVTLTEETNGAAAFHGFNFVLCLKTYSAIGTLNADNDVPGAVVSFVPCNLLEMLYATVFSTALGVDPYERYPVTYLTRYADITSGAGAIFNKPVRVAVRNGVTGNWTDALGTAYASAPTTELYRT